jgi:hypothetical protein
LKITNIALNVCFLSVGYYINGHVFKKNQKNRSVQNTEDAFLQSNAALLEDKMENKLM